MESHAQDTSTYRPAEHHLDLCLFSQRERGLHAWVVVGSYSVNRYESQITKSRQLIFSALLGDDGTRNVRFERALGI